MKKKVAIVGTMAFLLNVEVLRLLRNMKMYVSDYDKKKIKNENSFCKYPWYS